MANSSVWGFKTVDVVKALSILERRAAWEWVEFWKASQGETFNGSRTRQQNSLGSGSAMIRDSSVTNPTKIVQIPQSISALLDWQNTSSQTTGYEQTEEAGSQKKNV